MDVKEASLEASDAIPRLAEDATIIDRHFQRIGEVSVYTAPLIEPVKYEVGHRGVVNEYGFIVNLDPAEQLMFVDSLSKQTGRKLRLLSFNENFAAAFLEGDYAARFLDYYWVYTNEFVVNLGKKSSVRKVRGVELTNDIPYDHFICQGEMIHPISMHDSSYGVERVGRRYLVGPVIQTGIFTRSGDFNNVPGVLPQDSDLIDSERITGEEKGCTWKLSNSDDVYAIRCHRNGRISDNPRLHVDGVKLSDIPDVMKMGTTIGICTDENPRK
jgi:hypothetical protein